MADAEVGAPDEERALLVEFNQWIGDRAAAGLSGDVDGFLLERRTKARIAQVDRAHALAEDALFGMGRVEDDNHPAKVALQALIDIRDALTP